MAFLSLGWEYNCLLPEFVSVTRKLNSLCSTLREQFLGLPRRQEVLSGPEAVIIQTGP